jgi:hypothetical protein
MALDLKALAAFLVKAKVNTYAGDGTELIPQRPGFTELEFLEGDWAYRDSYQGYFYAPGQEVVRFKGKPVWEMAYSGGMLKEFHGNLGLAKQTYAFLKKALLLVEAKRPFRGPNRLTEGDWEYIDRSEGTISDFSGTEHIFYKGKEVYKQHYIGGLIVQK